MEKLNSKPTALITGGARRIGELFASTLAQQGWNIIISHAHSDEEAGELAASLNQQYNCDVAIEKCDLNSTDQAAQLINNATRHFGSIRLLINNAANFNNDVLVKNPELASKIPPTMSLDNFEKHHRIICASPVLISQAFAMQYFEASEASESKLDQENKNIAFDPMIVNILDQRVMRPYPLFFSYLSAKMAMQNLTSTMAQAFAPKIRVNGIAPGPIFPSPRQSQTNFDNMALNTLLKRKVNPDDLVNCLLFLLRTSSVTGQTIAIDNGQHLNWQTPDAI